MRADGERASLALGRAALEGAAGREAFGRLSRFARSLGVSAHDAQDIVQKAMEKFLRGGWAWSPESHPDVVQYLMGMVRSEVRDERRRARRTPEKPGKLIDEAPAHAQAATDHAAAPVRDALVETAFTRLRERLVKDSTALGVVELTEDGVGDRAVQAERLRVPIGEIYDAHDRIQRHVRRIARELAEKSRSEEVPHD